MVNQAFTAAIIDKGTFDKGTVKKFTSDFRKKLAISKKSIQHRELNSFLILTGTLQASASKLEERLLTLERGELQKRYTSYYQQMESTLRRELKNSRELRETAKIIQDFVSQIDKELNRKLNDQIKAKIYSLPEVVYTTHTKAFVSLSVLEGTTCRIFLGGAEAPIFSGRIPPEVNNNALNDLIERLAILNFLFAWMQPTLEALTDIEAILDAVLRLALKFEFVKPSDTGLERRLNSFLRILVAKLSSLSGETLQIFGRIFELYQLAKEPIGQYNFKSPVQSKFGFETITLALGEMTSQGKELIGAIHPKLIQVSTILRDCCEKTNGVQYISQDEYKEEMHPFTALCVDLFVCAERIRVWGNQFGGHLPYFSFSQNGTSNQQITSQNISRPPILVCRGVRKNYQLGKTTVYALRDVNLTIYEGEFLAITGSSGAGKTTLLNVMAGLDTPDHGEVLFRGQNLHKMKDKERSKSRLLEMGFIFQNYALLPHYNTRENVGLPADLAGFSKKLRQRIEELLEGVGIDGQAKQFPAQLSGGQMQRVSIARALTNRPAVIFADEPTGDLDSGTGKQVMELLKLFHEETQTTIIIITHEEDIAAYAERRIEMRDGLIAA